MNGKFYKFVFFILLVCLGGWYVYKWQKPPKVVTKTEIEYVTDTITRTIIEEKPVTRYVERVKNIRGRDTIIYREVPTDNTIEAKEYKARIETDSAYADLRAVVSGTLWSLNGTITYPKEIKTIKTYQNASGLFLSGQTDLKLQNFGIGLDYVFKNTIIVGGNVNYNTYYNSSYVGLKVGIKIK